MASDDVSGEVFANPTSHLLIPMSLCARLLCQIVDTGKMPVESKHYEDLKKLASARWE